VKVAAYQAPLLPSGSLAAVELICRRIAECETEGVEILCCPEAILGGLADSAPGPIDFALNVESGQLAATLAPLASATVTTLVGFTEIADGDRLCNSAAVFHRGAVLGVYRKVHPAIRRSVYNPGDQTPVFTVNGLTFGIILCYDSTFPELARLMTAQGATALFIPSNTALPSERKDVVGESRKADIALAVENGIYVIRADVAGRAEGRVSYGSSGVVDPQGKVLRTARRLKEDLLVIELKMAL
jgi:predicted amidohydrolase